MSYADIDQTTLAATLIAVTSWFGVLGAGLWLNLWGNYNYDVSGRVELARHARYGGFLLIAVVLLSPFLIVVAAFMAGE